MITVRWVRRLISDRFGVRILTGTVDIEVDQACRI
jgi:hypothetical protein